MRTTTPLSAAELANLPVFPLPRVVLFPGSELPLHLFEPRYRRMIADCIAHGPMAMAVAQLKPGWEENYGNRPAIHAVAGAGRITLWEKLPDGTYDIMVEAVARVRLEEHPGKRKGYRCAQATVLEDRTDKLRDADVAALLSTATSISRYLRKTHPRFCLDLPRDAPPGLLTDRLADRLIVDPTARQRLLEAVCVAERVQLLTMALVEIRRELEGVTGGGGQLAH